MKDSRLIRATVFIGWTSCLLGFLFLYWSIIYGSFSNYFPLNIPFPGKAMISRDTFEISSAGHFAVVVVTPVGASSRGQLHREQPTVTSHVRVNVQGTNGYSTTREITEFLNEGWNSNFDMYYPNCPMLILSRGAYQLTVSNDSNVAIFENHGAMLQLERVEPTGPHIGFILARWLGYTCLAIGLVLFLVFLRDQLRRQGIDK